MRACADPAIVRFTRIPHPYTLEDGEWFVDHATCEAALGRAFHSAVCAEGPDDQILGCVGLVIRPDRPHIGEVGYWIAPWARRRGAATAAVRLAVAVAGGLRLARVEAYIHPDNAGSRRTVERVGFRREGLLHSHGVGRNGLEDMLLYAREGASTAGSVSER